MFANRIKVFLCCLPLSSIIIWTIANAKSERVTSLSDQASVNFGWPFRWIEQDISRLQFSRYPQHVRLSWVKFDQFPTQVDWTFFATNVAILSLALMGFYRSIPAIVAFIRRSRS
jgi:hypothetical protein